MEFFAVEEGLLVERWRAPAEFPTLKAQYCFFAERCAVLLFQVGSFVEFYDGQAKKAMMLLNLKQLAGGRGFGLWCGFPIRLTLQVRCRFLRCGLPVTVVRERGERPWPGRVKLRHVAESW